MPAVLIECGFMDSKTDVPIILSDDFPGKAAKGIAAGIARAFGFELSSNEPAEKPTHWAQKCLDSLADKGIISDPTQWDDFDQSVGTITIGQLLALVDKATN